MLKIKDVIDQLGENDDFQVMMPKKTVLGTFFVSRTVLS